MMGFHGNLFESSIETSEFVWCDISDLSQINDTNKKGNK